MNRVVSRQILPAVTIRVNLVAAVVVFPALSVAVDEMMFTPRLYFQAGRLIFAQVLRSKRGTASTPRCPPRPSSWLRIVG
jgi:hypothetical protein